MGRRRRTAAAPALPPPRSPRIDLRCGPRAHRARRARPRLGVPRRRAPRARRGHPRRLRPAARRRPCGSPPAAGSSRPGTLSTPSTLIWVVVGLGVLGAPVGGRRRGRLPDARAGPARRAAGACSAASSSRCSSRPSRCPAVAAAYVAPRAARDLIAEVFDDGESATVVDVPGPVRRQGAGERPPARRRRRRGPRRRAHRHASSSPASTPTRGETTLFSLPRNLENLPFPEDSPLAEVYPDGFWPAPRARACSTPSTATARPSTPTSSAPPTTRARTSSSSASARRSA